MAASPIRQTITPLPCRSPRMDPSSISCSLIVRESPVWVVAGLSKVQILSYRPQAMQCAVLHKAPHVRQRCEERPCLLAQHANSDRSIDRVQKRKSVLLFEGEGPAICTAEFAVQGGHEPRASGNWRNEAADVRSEENLRSASMIFAVPAVGPEQDTKHKTACTPAQ